MIYIQSILFHILFYILNIVMCTGLLWSLILPRKWTFKILFYGYFSPIYQLEKYVLGLNFKVEGREHIPPNGAYIVAMKHQSAYETLKMFHLFGDIRIILKRELTWLPLWGWYAAKVGMIPVDRNKGRKAIESMLDNAKPVIEAGVPIMIYPQGTRVSIHDTVSDRPYKQGVQRVYERYNIPILPVAMNSGLFWPRQGFWLKGGTVTFKILPPIPSGLPSDEAHQKMQDVVESESLKLLKDEK
jgi:1-acyl-sn-glycerol-3-phosphate acyltransferase